MELRSVRLKIAIDELNLVWKLKSWSSGWFFVSGWFNRLLSS